jgi:hypothetical protein
MSATSILIMASSSTTNTLRLFLLMLYARLNHLGGGLWRTMATCLRPPDAPSYIPWLWNTFWQLLLSFARFSCKHC